MIKPISIPRGIANIFLIGLANADSYNEETQYRPDKIHSNNGISGIKDEIIDNYISVMSPIEACKGTIEIFVQPLFKSYFGV